MPRFSLQFRDRLRHVRRWRDGEYADLVAARCDAIVEAKNLLAEGGAVEDGVIEIHDGGGRLVSRIALIDVKAPASGVAVPQPRGEAQAPQDAGLQQAQAPGHRKPAGFGHDPEAALCPA